jgi:hypothetical protein
MTRRVLPWLFVVAFAVAFYVMPNPVPEKFRLAGELAILGGALLFLAWRVHTRRMKVLPARHSKKSLGVMFCAGLVLIPAAIGWIFAVAWAMPGLSPGESKLFILFPAVLILAAGSGFLAVSVTMGLYRLLGIARKDGDG